ncbi:MAG: hypothetical protein ACKVP1_10445, partial [Burkholderiaceae bacterium]
MGALKTQVQHFVGENVAWEKVTTRRAQNPSATFCGGKCGMGKSYKRRAQNPSATFCGGKCGMGKSYKQLSIEERTLIQTQLSIGMKP